MEEERKKIIKEIIDKKLVETCVSYRLNKCKSQYYKDELEQETWFWLLTYDLDKLKDAYENNHLSALITRFLINQYFSKTSDFFKKFKKYDNSTDEITDRERNIPDPDIKLYGHPF